MTPYEELQLFAATEVFIWNTKNARKEHLDKLTKQRRKLGYEDLVSDAELEDIAKDAISGLLKERYTQGTPADIPVDESRASDKPSEQDSKIIVPEDNWILFTGKKPVDIQPPEWFMP